MPRAIEISSMPFGSSVQSPVISGKLVDAEKVRLCVRQSFPFGAPKLSTTTTIRGNFSQKGGISIRLRAGTW
jgi:hypothetical protein